MTWANKTCYKVGVLQFCSPLAVVYEYKCRVSGRKMNEVVKVKQRTTQEKSTRENGSMINRVSPLVNQAW